jgi:hypothetical protein
VNFQSLKTKQAEFLNLLDSVKPDIVFGTETWVDASVTDSQIVPPGYIVYRKDRKMNGGGVLLAVRDTIRTCAAPEFDTDCEIVWCKLDIVGHKSLYLCSYYNPKTSNQEGFVQFRQSLERASSVNNACILVAGDFNMPGIDWRSKSVKAGCQHSATHQYFLDTVEDYGLSQLVDAPTRGTNVLDLVLTNRPASVIRTEVLPGVSDQDVVFFELSVTPVKNVQKPREILLYKKANWDMIRQDLKNVLRDINTMQNSNRPVNEIWNTFQSCLEDSVKRNIPTKMTKSKDRCPWISHDIRKLIKKRDRWYKRMKKSGNGADRSKFKELKKTTQRELRKAYWRYIDGVVTPNPDEKSSGGGTNKRFWTFIKHRKSDGNFIPPLKSNGLLYSGSKEKADILNEQFEKAFSKSISFELSENGRKFNVPGQYSEMPDIHVTEKGVLKLLNNLKANKAPGPDNISPRILKELATDVAPILTCIFNLSYQTGEVPEIWKSANVCPIYKKGKRFEAINYRPVSLTCIACKIMEHIITSNIMKHADSQKILYPFQHGFRRGLSCETQLIELIDDVTVNMDEGKQTDCLVMDFSKAFDKVSHSLLTYKLNHYGIRGKTNQWIKSFLSGRTQRVVVEGDTSDSIPVASGVPQGSVLGPSLFLFYINDMPHNIASKIRLFADDTISYLAVTSESDCDVLQRDLDKLALWEDKWLMQFHPEKCNVLSITKNRNLIRRNYTLRDHVLEQVTSTKYLGVTISSDLKWTPHINNICGKANGTIGFLKRNLNISNRHIKEKAYKSLVRPVLEYACAAWDPHLKTDIDKLEKVQRRAARYVLNRYHNRSSVTDMIHTLEWKPLVDRRRVARLSMFYRLANGKVAVDTDDKLIPYQRQSRNFNTHAFQIPICRTNIRKESFYPRTTREWNILPTSFVSAPSLESFKAHLAA